jgi:predicted nuclease of predicted toxin-antitoxin system
VKFLVDMPLSPALARWLVDAGYDAIHAGDIGMERAPDVEIVSHASQNERIVITADLDYARLLALTGALEPSLILFRGGDWSDDEVIARINQLLQSVVDAEIERSIFVIERNRVRRRRLPIRD